jgi:carbon storage regulator
MLVLSRKPGETIVVGDDIIVTVVSINGNRIKLGIEAPPEVSIKRRELLFESPGKRHSAPADRNEFAVALSGT